MDRRTAGQNEPGRVAWRPRLRQVVVNGVALRVGTHGEGPPLLLINGIGANIEMWEPLASQLPGRRLLMFDFPGTGASAPLPRPMRMRSLASMLERLLDQLGFASCDVVGYSWGGTLAQQLVHQAPDRIRSLVLAATTPGLGGRSPAPWVVAAMSTPLRYYSPAYLRLVAPVIFGSRVRQNPTHVRARRALPPTMRGYGHQLYALAGWSSRPWLRTVRTPTLVLSGQGDPLVPSSNARILARTIPGARLQELPGGHLFLLQNPDAAAAAIAAFLSASESGGYDASVRSTT